MSKEKDSSIFSSEYINKILAKDNDLLKKPAQ